MPFVRASCLALLVMAAGPQTPTTTAASSAAPVAATMVVRLSSATGIYHVGEEIPLDLEFRGTADKDYFFTSGGCGFFGRKSSAEEISVTPTDGTEDPMADPFPPSEHGGTGSSCGFSLHPLDGTPLIMHASINDAVRFTRPGTYSLAIKSTRMGRYSSQPAPTLSAVVELTVVPADDTWAATDLARATNLIARGAQADVRRGATILRYLGTEPAMNALVNHYDVIEPVDSEIDHALILSPHRASIVAAMEARVDAGEHLTPNFFSTLTRVRVRLDLPPDVKDFATRNSRLNAISSEYDARWRAAIASQPVTAATLGAELALFSNASPEFKQEVADDLDHHPAEATAAFVALPTDTQWVLLRPEMEWTFNGSWALPALRQIFARGNSNRSGFSPADDALTHLYELAPDEGRRLILEEIKTGEHGIGYDALAILPDASLPELDAALQVRYASPQSTNAAMTLRNRGTAAWLMARYGSPNLLPFVRDILTRSTDIATRSAEGCVVEGAAIAYLLKHDLPAAMKRFDQSTVRTASGICADPLPALAEHYWDDRVESVAIVELTTAADISRVSNAARLLGDHGSVAAKQPLLDRLAEWSKEWHGRATELVFQPSLPSPSLVENSVVNALLQGATRFALTKSDGATIRALCVTDNCRAMVDARASGLK